MTDSPQPDHRRKRQLYRLIRIVQREHPTASPGELAQLLKDRLHALRIPQVLSDLDEALSTVLRHQTTRTPLAPRARHPPVRQIPLTQVDPPWPVRRGPSTWTSVADLASAHKCGLSDRKT